MRKLIVLIAVVAGVWYWSGGDLPFSSPAGAFDDAGNPVVWVFTAKGCGAPCRVGLKELKKRDVPFMEKEIHPDDENDENFKLWKKMGRGAFPFIVSGEQRVMGSSKAQLATLLGENFDEKYLTRTEKRYFKKHFYPDGSARIVMYGTDWCPYCAKLRKEFKEQGVDYIEVDVEKSGEHEKMSQVMEINGYPATWIGYTRVNGTTLSAIKAAMN